MYDKLNTLLSEARSPDLERERVLAILREASLDATILVPSEEFDTKRDLFLACVEDLLRVRRLNKIDLCTLADEIASREVRFGKSLDMRLAASLRRMAICP